MARSYDMRRRERAAADTRARILEAAHGLLNRSESTGLTVQEVAAAAGVSRQTIYKSVGSRRELLSALFEDQGRQVEYERVLAASGLADAAEAVIAVVRESCRSWSLMPEALRKTLALAVMDREIRELVQQYERYRRAEMRLLAKRAHQAGVLRADLSVEEAGATLALLTGFPVFDELCLEFDARRATEHLVRTVRSALGITH
ncbi:MAG: TetR/AcrR family transcriptional regulator [Longimicrobiales bacterium]